MIASLVALSAANMRDSRSFCSSARAFSSARSKLASANDTFSASRCNSAIISGLKVPNSLERNTSAPIASPFLSKRQRRAGLAAAVADHWVDMRSGPKSLR